MQKLIPMIRLGWQIRILTPRPTLKPTDSSWPRDWPILMQIPKLTDLPIQKLILTPKDSSWPKDLPIRMLIPKPKDLSTRKLTPKPKDSS